ncbi:MAG: hypothetical protein M1814_001629 [Vezdaea aestivalis]|nr:MAG: hypothetical protein M1814_001629 [Vezdaea aestivalis]
MASGMSGTSCVAGVKHEEVECYWTDPPTPHPYHGKDHVILFLTDIFGHSSPNAQLLADSFAEATGLSVCVPDLFSHDAVPWPRPAYFDLSAWLSNHTEDLIERIIDKVISYLRITCDRPFIGAAGYCLGAKYVLRYLRERYFGFTKTNLFAGFVAHPSFVTISEWEAAIQPLAVAAAEVDERFSIEERGKVEQILSRGTRTDGTKLPWEMTVFAGTTHGFAIRGDKDDEQVKWAMERALAMGAGWFKRFVV